LWLQKYDKFPYGQQKNCKNSQFFLF
jgi:hypothetical protein